MVSGISHFKLVEGFGLKATSPYNCNAIMEDNRTINSNNNSTNLNNNKIKGKTCFQYNMY